MNEPATGIRKRCNMPYSVLDNYNMQAQPNNHNCNQMRISPFLPMSSLFFRSVLFRLFICFRCYSKCIDPFVTSNNLTPANFNVTHIHYDCYCLPWPSLFVLCEVVCKAYWVQAFHFVSFLRHFPITPPSVDGSVGCVYHAVYKYITRYNDLVVNGFMNASAVDTN